MGRSCICQTANVRSNTEPSEGKVNWLVVNSKMKIILNSDVLRTGSLIKDRLPGNWLALFDECKKKGYPIIIPQTVALEFDRLQSKHGKAEIKRLNDAYRVLDEYHVRHDPIDPSGLILKPDIVELIRKLGAEVTVENPTYDDFVEAHKRACLHEAPGSDEQKYDEMRDLIIWVIAIRTALKDGKALLVSNDEMHSGPAGNKEAVSVGLVRVRSFGEALGYFGFDTPSGALIKQIIESIWDDLLEAELPLEKTMTMIGVYDPIFIQKLENILEVSSIIALKTSDGKSLGASMQVLIFGDVIESVYLSAIKIAGTSSKKPELSFRPRKSISIEKDDYEERLRALKDVLGG
jgi:hypothetical protein